MGCIIQTVYLVMSIAIIANTIYNEQFYKTVGIEQKMKYSMRPKKQLLNLSLYTVYKSKKNTDKDHVNVTINY